MRKKRKNIWLAALFAYIEHYGGKENGGLLIMVLPLPKGQKLLSIYGRGQICIVWITETLFWIFLTWLGCS